MPLLIYYLLKFSVSLAVVYLFYHFVLRKLTFYNWNRWYLVGYTLISFFLAAINITPLLKSSRLEDTDTIRLIPNFQIPVTHLNNGNQISGSGGLDQWSGIFLVVGIGVVLLLIQFTIRYYSFTRLRRNAELLLDDSVRLYQVNKNIIPFSFGRSVFINRSLHSSDELKEIIRHEFVHVRQKHTLDILWAEFLCIFNWYNPFAWLIRRSVRQNLEFIADDKVLQNGIDRKQYQYMLVKVIGNNQFSIAQKFNFSSLKKRIAMMNKMKSASLHIVKFLFILPLVVVLLVAFRNKGKDVIEPRKKAEQLTSRSALHQASYILPRDTEPTVITARTYDRRKIREISTSAEINEDKAILHLKDGTTEEYDLKNPKEKEKFFDKYGIIMTTRMRSPRNPDERIVEGVGIGSGEGKGVRTDALNGIEKDNEEIEHYGEEDPLKPQSPTCKTICVSVNNKVSTSVVSKVIHCVNITKPVIAVSVTKPVGYTVSTEPMIAVGITNPVVSSVTTEPRISVGLTKSVVSPVTSIAPNMLGVIKEEPSLGISKPGIAVKPTIGYALKPNENILLTINRTTTKEQLEDYKKQMKEKGVELNYTDIKFDEKGRLSHISGTLKTENSTGNFSATDFARVLLILIKDGDKAYFRVNVMDYSKTVI